MKNDQTVLELQNEKLMENNLQLEHSLARYINLYEFSPVGLLILDDKGHIQDANLTFATMLGIDRHMVVSRRLTDFIFDGTVDRYTRLFQNLNASQQPQQCEIVLRHSNHSLLTVRLDATIVPLNQAENLTHYCVAISNVTAQKQSDAQALGVETERQRVKVLADFIRDTSHDLRTPITAIITGLYLVGKIADKEQQLEKIAGINQQLFYLTRVLDQLQFMAVLDSTFELELQLENINRMVMSVSDLASSQISSKNLNLTLDLQDNLPHIFLNSDMMEKAITNLLDNALQFSSHGGSVVVSTRQDGASVVLEIHNDGIGIDADQIPSIFERFFKADSARRSMAGGAGLGLPMAKRIIDLHHGTVAVRSTPGAETVCTVSLPLNSFSKNV